MCFLLGRAWKNFLKTVYQYQLDVVRALLILFFNKILRKP